MRKFFFKNNSGKPVRILKDGKAACLKEKKYKGTV